MGVNIKTKYGKELKEQEILKMIDKEDWNNLKEETK